MRKKSCERNATLRWRTSTEGSCTIEKGIRGVSRVDCKEWMFSHSYFIFLSLSFIYFPSLPFWFFSPFSLTVSYICPCSYNSPSSFSIFDSYSLHLCVFWTCFLSFFFLFSSFSLPLAKLPTHWPITLSAQHASSPFHLYPYIFLTLCFPFSFSCSNYRSLNRCKKKTD